MEASYNGHHDIVRTLLEAKADLNAKTKVRNQMMMIIIIINTFNYLDDDDDDDDCYRCIYVNNR
jgi:ankyrin repeat protein